MKKSKNKKAHITKEERIKIEALLKQGCSYAQIGTNLSRGKSTIAEEVTRNKGRKEYCARKAHARAKIRQKIKKRHCNKVAMSPYLTRFVEKPLRLGWSPERMATRLERLKKFNQSVEYASAKSIRKFVQSRALDNFLFSQRVPQKGGRKPGTWIEDTSRSFVPDMPTIKGFGTFEVDFIVSSKSNAVLLVLVDVETKITLMRILPNRINVQVNEVIVDMLTPYPTAHTLVPDNDIAFALWEELERESHTKIFFARPYRSTDKPLVENTNRWIRAMGIPKKTDLATVSDSFVASIEDWFNGTPRECLGGMTPLEKFAEFEGRDIITHTYPRHPVLDPFNSLPFVFGG